MFFSYDIPSVLSLSCRLGFAAALEDYPEGVEAFMSKRKPVWRHR